MGLTSDSEKQLLIETYLEPLTRTCPAQMKDSVSELREDAWSVGSLLLPERSARRRATCQHLKMIRDVCPERCS
ncbi:hypothetical protein ILYODFUR_014634 [Ilyodon furcidens]|uniref:Uncharacterized protein n=1 Tax=Ilyodon furcidens TaxID=33524 RepID=A0ABV0UHI0_9TELE